MNFKLILLGSSLLGCTLVDYNRYKSISEIDRSLDIAQLFRIILATNELQNDLKCDRILLALLVQIMPLFKFCESDHF